MIRSFFSFFFVSLFLHGRSVSLPDRAPASSFLLGRKRPFSVFHWRSNTPGALIWAVAPPPRFMPFKSQLSLSYCSLLFLDLFSPFFPSFFYPESILAFTNVLGNALLLPKGLLCPHNFGHTMTLQLIFLSHRNICLCPFPLRTLQKLKKQTMHWMSMAQIMNGRAP